MPLLSFQISDNTKILVWQITERLADLFDQARITDRSMFRMSTMKSLAHKRGFIAVRLLLQEAGYEDADLFYDEFGKPHLSDGTYISISHSHDYAAIILSDRNVGIDLELRRDKIAVIADKFMEPTLVLDKSASDYVNKLTVNWGIKEAIFKIRNEKGISFKQHIHARPFEMPDKKTTAELHFGNLIRTFEVRFEEIADYTLVYVFETSG